MYGAARGAAWPSLTETAPWPTMLMSGGTCADPQAYEQRRTGEAGRGGWRLPVDGGSHVLKAKLRTWA